MRPSARVPLVPTVPVSSRLSVAVCLSARLRPRAPPLLPPCVGVLCVLGAPAAVKVKDVWRSAAAHRRRRHAVRWNGALARPPAARDARGGVPHLAVGWLFGAQRWRPPARRLVRGDAMIARRSGRDVAQSLPPSRCLPRTMATVGAASSASAVHRDPTTSFTIILSSLAPPPQSLSSLSPLSLTPTMTTQEHLCFGASTQQR